MFSRFDRYFFFHKCILTKSECLRAKQIFHYTFGKRKRPERATKARLVSKIVNSCNILKCFMHILTDARVRHKFSSEMMMVLRSNEIADAGFLSKIYSCAIFQITLTPKRPLVVHIYMYSIPTSIFKVIFRYNTRGIFSHILFIFFYTSNVLYNIIRVEKWVFINTNMIYSNRDIIRCTIITLQFWQFIHSKIIYKTFHDKSNNNQTMSALTTTILSFLYFSSVYRLNKFISSWNCMWF